MSGVEKTCEKHYITRIPEGTNNNMWIQDAFESSELDILVILECISIREAKRPSRFYYRREAKLYRGLDTSNQEPLATAKYENRGNMFKWMSFGGNRKLKKLASGMDRIIFTKLLYKYAVKEGLIKQFDYKISEYSEASVDKEVINQVNSKIRGMGKLLHLLFLMNERGYSFGEAVERKLVIYGENNRFRGRYMCIESEDYGIKINLSDTGDITYCVYTYGDIVRDKEGLRKLMEKINRDLAKVREPLNKNIRKSRSRYSYILDKLMHSTINYEEAKRLLSIEDLMDYNAWIRLKPLLNMTMPNNIIEVRHPNSKYVIAIKKTYYGGKKHLRVYRFEARRNRSFDSVPREDRERVMDIYEDGYKIYYEFPYAIMDVCRVLDSIEEKMRQAVEKRGRKVIEY